ncbi:MAG: hypothetical protein ACYCW5_01420 [Thermoleophilia bacterium]
MAAPAAAYEDGHAQIAGAIRQVLESRDMKPRAERSGGEMESEDGVGNAVERIEAALWRRRPLRPMPL